MKKTFLILMISIFSTGSFAQKTKKPGPKKSSSKLTVLAKSENVSASIVDHVGSAAFYLLSSKAGKTDSLLVKAIINKAPENLPFECKLSPFTAKGDKLYLLTWKEKSIVGDPKKRLENISEIHSEVWDVNSGKSVFSNVNKVVNITEIVFLDPNNTASKTVEKVRREGFEMTVSPEGDILLKNKTQQDQLTYDAAEKKFIGVKSAPKPAVAKKK